MNSNNLQKLHLTLDKLPETEHINTVTHAQYFVPKIINTASAHFIQAKHLMLCVIKYQSQISVTFRFSFMTWPLYTGTLSTEECVGIVARRKSLPLSEKLTEVVLRVGGSVKTQLSYDRIYWLDDDDIT